MNRLPAHLALAALALATTAAHAQLYPWDSRHGGPRSAPPAMERMGPGYAFRPPPSPMVRMTPGYARRPPSRYIVAPPGMRPPNSLGSQWREQQDEARQGVRRGALAPMGSVIERIGRRTPGRQLDAGLEYEDGRTVYRVRWITSRGRRIDYIVDAATGAILRGG